MAERLDLNDVNIYYGDFHVVQNVSLYVPPCSVAAFISPSGCGKSTMFRSLSRMHEVTPDAYVTGEISLNGENIYSPEINPASIRNTIGMVFRHPDPFPAMSTKGNIMVGLKLAGVKSKACL